MSFDDLLKSLHQDYLASIPDKIKTIAALILAKDVDNVREAFHKLKGTGKTYGIPEVSEIGQVLEAICLERPVHALPAAQIALSLLAEVYAKRTGTAMGAGAGAGPGEKGVLDLMEDSRMLELKRLQS